MTAAFVAIAVGGLVWLAYRFIGAGRDRARAEMSEKVLDDVEKKNRVLSRLRNDAGYAERVRRKSFRK